MYIHVYFCHCDQCSPCRDVVGIAELERSQGTPLPQDEAQELREEVGRALVGSLYSIKSRSMLIYE